MKRIEIMAKVNVEFECRCFKQSAHQNGVEHPTFDEAQARAREMAAEMAAQFCGKHKFGVKPDGDDVLITVELTEPAE